MNIIITLLTTFFAIKSVGSKSNQANNAGQSKSYVPYFLGAFGVWWVISKYNEAKTTAAQNNQQNTSEIMAGQSTADGLAQRIMKAFGGYETLIGWIINTPFDDDESALYQIAREMYAAKNASKVAEAYKVLYKRTLSTDLQDKLNSEEFNTYDSILNGRALPSTANTTTVKPLPSTLPTNGTAVIVTPTINPKNIYTNATGVNVRYATKPWGVWKTFAKKGTLLGEYLGTETIVINGFKKQAYRFRLNQSASKLVFLVATDYVKLV
jgi:hypothetical protein